MIFEPSIIKPCIIALFLAAAPAIAPMAAHATTVIALTDTQLVEKADAICHATVIGTQAVTTDDGKLLTAVTVEVAEWLKSPKNTDKTYTFYTRGGQTGGFVQQIHGEGKFEKGQEIVAFLEIIPRYGSRPMLLGLSQGAFYITRQPLSRTDRKTAIAVKHQIVARTANVPKPSKFDQAADLESLLSMIRAQVQELSHE